MVDGRKKKRPGIEEQQQIITQAAVALFLKQGTQAVSIAQICDQADVSRPTFYRCFKDKIALLEHIYATSVNHAVADFFPSELDTAVIQQQAFRQAFELMYDKIFEEAELASLLFRESNDPNSPAYHIVNNSFEAAADVILNSLNLSDSKTIDKVVLKATMAANQWIVQDAIIKGLSPRHIREAKQAGWSLISRIFSN
jgi:AcrR family transcriptional regulator